LTLPPPTTTSALSGGGGAPSPVDGDWPPHTRFRGPEAGAGAGVGSGVEVRGRRFGEFGILKREQGGGAEPTNDGVVAACLGHLKGSDSGIPRGFAL